MTPEPLRARKRADLLSAMGALVAGVAIGTVFGGAFAPAWPFLLAAGLAAHGVGMSTRHRLDMQQAGRLPAVWQALYVGCWIAMAGAVIYGAWLVARGTLAA